MKLENYFKKYFNFSLENNFFFEIIRHNTGTFIAAYREKITQFPLSCHIITPKSFLNVHPDLYTREAANISGLIAFDYVEISHLVLE